MPNKDREAKKQSTNTTKKISKIPPRRAIRIDRRNDCGRVKLCLNLIIAKLNSKISILTNYYQFSEKNMLMTQKRSKGS